MKAIRISEFGGPEVLKMEEIERPVPGADEILVKLYSSGINPVDWVIRNGANDNLRPYLTLPMVSKDAKRSGWLLFFHPDFIWNTSLAKNIKSYEFFDYSVNEALYLSEKEKTMMINIFKFIEQEYHTNIDRFSENVIISQLEPLLSYADRFYNRQFLSNKKTNHQILEKLEILLSTYFQSANLKEKGLPNVQQISNELKVSANYLSTLLKNINGPKYPTIYSA